MLKGIKINKDKVQQTIKPEILTEEQKNQNEQEKLLKLQNQLIQQNKDMLNSFLQGDVPQVKEKYQKIQKDENKYFSLLFAKSLSKRTDSAFDADYKDLEQFGKEDFKKPEKRNQQNFQDNDLKKHFKSDKYSDNKGEFDKTASQFYLKNKIGQNQDDVIDNEYEQNNDDKDKKQQSKKEIKYEQKRQQRTQQLESKQHKKDEKILSSCKYCLQNKCIINEQIISNGQHSLLIFPIYKRYQDTFHFQIIPLDHVESIRGLDEEIYDEFRNFMKCLVGAFDKIDQEVIFFENAFNLQKMPHCVIECIALPKKRAANAEIYFKKAIEESESEWSVHHKIIQLSKEKGGIRKQIPKGFPYFFVDFNLSFGYAHVVEDDNKFSTNFAHEIIATILQIDKQQVLHPEKYKKDELTQQQKKFQQIWIDFDWTQMLN